VKDIAVEGDALGEERNNRMDYPGKGYGWRSSSRDLPKATFKDVSVLRILRLFQPYILQLAIILGLSLTAAIIGLGPPLVMREVIDRAIPQGDRRLLLELVALMVALPLSSGLLGVLQNYLNTKVGQAVMRDLRQKLFHNLQRQSMMFFTNSRSGEVIQRVTGDVQMVQGVVTSTIISGITQSVVLISSVCIMFSLDWKLTLLSMLILPLFVLPVRRVARLRKEMRLEAQKVRSEMTSHLNETFGVSGALLTRLFAREERQQDRFTEINQKSMDLELKLNLVGRWFSMFTGILTPLGTALIYLYGGWNAIGGTLTIGGIVAFAAYLGRLYNPVQTLLNLHIEVMTALAVFQRIFEYQDMVPDVQEAPDAVDLPEIKGHIALENVSFAYKPNEPALRKINFQVQPGQLVALVGPSGAGKSTLIGLLARLYDPKEGCVRIDGHDLRKVSLKSLRQQIAFVTQESYLFHATVRENLLFAKEDATQEEIEEACRKAYIHDLIMSFPEGYDTMVGERGHRLSGGERQRLSIARAILKNPRILVLDEATSHLDSQSEAYVQRALEELMKGRTAIVIAHRLSTVLKADKILVMNKGRLVEQGSHAELLRKNGIYADLYHTQFAMVSGE
jgi:ATP-binding cassette subfamily B protein